MPPYFLILATKKDAKSGVITAIFGFIAATCPAVNLNLSCSIVIAAEQKARAVYDNILRLSDDPDVNEVIKFLRQREVVHLQRFVEPKLTISNRFSINIKGAEGKSSAPKFYHIILVIDY